METIYIESYDPNVKPDLKGTYEKIQIRKALYPKIAKVKRFKQTGHRKWSTIYQVRDDQSAILFSSEKEGDAIKEARRLSHKKIKIYYVTIAKSLINSDPKVAVVSPSKSRPGKWKFLVIGNGTK